jgi:DNA repair protein RadA/Sms
MTTATKTAKPSFRCAECGWTTTKWVGRCGECQAWDTIDITGPRPVGRTATGPVSTAARPITDTQTQSAAAVGSGLGELDRVLGGGVVPGSVLLLAGEPGVGKSTLLLEVAARWSGRADEASPGRATRRTVALYITGEESAGQVRLRAERTGALHDSLYLAAETDLGAVLSHIDAVQPDLLIVDSVQTIASADIDGVAGGVAQIREVTSALIKRAKAAGIATLLVGHVTKDGTVAGPRALEHLVDVVLNFEGDRTSQLRLLRSTKNRFGPVDEIGCFDLVDSGIVEVPDPTGLFVSRHERPVPGTCVTAIVEGRRPLMAEVQALCIPGTPSPRRTTSGLDANRVAMVLAVLTKHVVPEIGSLDVYAASVGGARLTEPAVDLAAAAALISSVGGFALPAGLVAIGEVGLAGEVRRVTQGAARLREAARLGFRTALVPPGCAGPGSVGGIEIVEVPDVAGLSAVLRTRAVRP